MKKSISRPDAATGTTTAIATTANETREIAKFVINKSIQNTINSGTTGVPINYKGEVYVPIIWNIKGEKVARFNVFSKHHSSTKQLLEEFGKQARELKMFETLNKKGKLVSLLSVANENELIKTVAQIMNM